MWPTIAEYTESTQNVFQSLLCTRQQTGRSEQASKGKTIQNLVWLWWFASNWHMGNVRWKLDNVNCTGRKLWHSTGIEAASDCSRISIASILAGVPYNVVQLPSTAVSTHKMHIPCPDDQQQQYGKTGSRYKLSFSISLDSALKAFKLTSDTQSYHLPVFWIPVKFLVHRVRSPPPPHICLAEPGSLGLPSVVLLKPVRILNVLISYASPSMDQWTFCWDP